MTDTLRADARHPIDPAPRRRLLVGGLSAAVVSSLPVITRAQAWPTRPITLVVTYPPGGGADQMARLIAPKLAEMLGQQVVVENKPGASGQIGAALVAKATPDGHTAMLDASQFAVNPSLYPKLPYDPDKAFRTVGVTALYPNVLVVHPGFEAQSAADLIRMAKARPGTIPFASSGNGSAQHLAAELFESRTGIDLVHVPYKGGGPAMTDVMGGQVPVFFANVASGLQHIRAGKLRALALTGARRTGSLPDVPTMAEAGVSGCEIYEWNAVFLPAGTPDEVVRRFGDALRKVMASADVRERVQSLGGEVFTGEEDAATQFIRQQTTQWGRMVRERDIKVD